MLPDIPRVFHPRVAARDLVGAHTARIVEARPGRVKRAPGGGENGWFFYLSIAAAPRRPPQPATLARPLCRPGVVVVRLPWAAIHMGASPGSRHGVTIAAPCPGRGWWPGLEGNSGFRAPRLTPETGAWREGDQGVPRGVFQGLTGLPKHYPTPSMLAARPIRQL